MSKHTLIGRGAALGLAAQIVGAAPGRAAPVLPVAPVKPVTGPAIVQVDAQQIQVNARPPIPFTPFPLVDPHTGQPVSADTLITLHSGKRMKAGAYYAELNDLERQFNALGYTLRDPGVVKLQALKVNQQQLQAQIALIRALSPAGAQNPTTQGVSAGQTALPATAAHVAAVVPRGVTGGIVANLGYYPQSVTRSWDYSLGSTDTIGAELTGQMNVMGSDQGISANGSTRASGAILGDQWDLLRVSASANAPQSGPLAAQVTMYVVGVGDLSLINQSVTQPVLNASNSFSQPLDVHQDFHFSVGPIPMSARLGMRGSAGVQYALNLKPVNAGVTLQPQVRVDGYGQGGVDLDIASGGIGADLTLLHDQVQFGATAAVLTVGNGPALLAHCYGTDNLDALGGRLYAYAKVDLGIYDKEWDWDIWNWSGLQQDFTLFDDSHTLQLIPRRPVAVAG